MTHKKTPQSGMPIMQNISLMKTAKDYFNRTTYLVTRFRDEVQGVAAIEFAFLAPLMLLMYVGTIEISNAMSANRKLSRVSSTVGDLITQAECFTDATLTDIMKITDDIMFPYQNTLSIQISGVSIDNGIAEVEWSKAYGGATPAANGSPYTVPTKIKIDGNFLVAAKINMAYHPAVGWLNYETNTSLSKDTTAINMEEEMFLRPRIGNEIKIEASC